MHALASRILLFLTFLVSLSHSSMAESAEPELTERQREIIHVVRSSEGYVDEKLHSEFWSLMPDQLRKSPNNRKALMDLLADVSGAREKFLLEAFMSAKASLLAKQVVRTPEYVLASRELLAASALPSYQDAVRESIESSERMIRAAATGEAIDAPGTRTFVTIEQIERAVTAIKVSESRLAKLVEYPWSDIPTEFRYPEAHVSILSIIPFEKERQTIGSANGKAVEMITLSQQVNASSFLTVNFSSTNGRLTDPSKSLISIAKAALAGSGASGSPPIAITWRGRSSAIASGVSETSDGNLFVSVRTIEAREVGGVYQILVVSDMSAGEALNQRLKLEDAINITP